MCCVAAPVVPKYFSPALRTPPTSGTPKSGMVCLERFGSDQAEFPIGKQEFPIPNCELPIKTPMLVSKSMNLSELEQLLHDITTVRIGVVGDYCLDAYWILDPAGEEISVETKLPTRAVSTQRYAPGGAGNVVMNLLAMGVRNLSAFGAVGSDPFGQYMLSLLESHNVETHGMLSQTGDWSTHVYCKPYVGEKEENRIDFGNFNVLHDTSATGLCEQIGKAMGNLDLIVINEQVQRGIHNSSQFQSLLGRLISENPRKIFLLDSRHKPDQYPGAVRKINEYEASRICGLAMGSKGFLSDDQCNRAATLLYERWSRPVFLTRGPRGCLVCDITGVHNITGIAVQGPVDPVGAGDSMLAGIAAALAAGRDCVKAAMLGNLVAGVTVQKLRQTGVASPEEIEELFKRTG